MLDDGLLRRFNCLAMVSKDYKSESRTVCQLECCQHCTKEFQLIFKPKKKDQREKTNKHFIFSLISEYGHTCFKVSFKINSSLTTGTCMYICEWVYNIQNLKLYMRLYTHTSLYCKSFQKSFFYMSCMYNMFCLYFTNSCTVLCKSRCLCFLHTYIYMYKYWIHEACMCKCL